MEENLRKKADQSALRLWRINETIFAAYPHYLAASGAPSWAPCPASPCTLSSKCWCASVSRPARALAAATNNYSLQFGWTELGQIAPGRRADILVIDGDPTVSIWNVRRISTLILDGNVIDREALLNFKR